MKQLTWDQTSYLVDGQRQFLISGEVHYFRVPHSQWETRLKLLKESGANCVATYIPWILHEPTEGTILFGDIPQRDLEGFLRLCQKMDLMVICRPGPYQYSELKNDGLPGWLCRDYPQLLARNIQGEIFRGSSVSYLHPLFLEKTKKWFDVVCPILARYMVSRGGPVVMVQIDNELMGIHEWFSGWDYNPTTMGFFTQDGRYPSYLRKKYANLDYLNRAYGSGYESFSQVSPADVTGGAAEKIRRNQDYQHFYFETIAEYVQILFSWMREAGIDCQIVHNSGSPKMNSFFLDTTDKMKTDLLLGSDHYYNLNQEWNQNNPTPQYAISVYCSHEMLRLMGYPPTAFEIPGGSFSDWPPVMPEDLSCCLLTNVALGMKGMNYYIFTGGPNPEGVSHFGKIYDYGAPVSAFGEIRPTYYATQRVAQLLQENSWLAGAQRLADFHVGLDWEQSRSRYTFENSKPLGFANEKAWEFVKKGVLTTAFCASYSANFLELRTLDLQQALEKPLFVASSVCMSQNIQEKLVAFLEAGGKLILAPVLPSLDENLEPCHILQDYLHAGGCEPYLKTSPSLNVGNVEQVLSSGSLWCNPRRPADARQIAEEAETKAELGWKLELPGGGKVIWLGMQWMHTKFEHSHMLTYLLEEMGCNCPMVHGSNPNIWASLRSDGTHYALFLMNLYSSKMDTSVQVTLPGFHRTYENISLAPMEVKIIQL